MLSTPLFPHAELALGAIGTRQGGTLTIDAPHTNADRRYIATARIGARPIKRTYADLAQADRGVRAGHGVQRGVEAGGG